MLLEILVLDYAHGSVSDLSASRWAGRLGFSPDTMEV